MDYDPQFDNDLFYGKPYPKLPSKPPVQGRKYAIVAFVFAIMAFQMLMSIFSLRNQLWELFSQIYPDEILRMSLSVLAVFSILYALVSDGFVIPAYIGHSRNVRNDVRSKLVIVFAIIATVLANLSLLISLIVLLS